MHGGHHESLSAHGEVKTASDRSVGVVFGIVFAIVAGFQAYAGRIEIAVGCAAAAAVFLLLAALRPGLLAPLNRVWTRLGLVLHRIVNPIVMGFIYFVVFTPMGIAMRLGGFDPLRQRGDAGLESYWIARDPAGPAPETMRKQF